MLKELKDLIEDGRIIEKINYENIIDYNAPMSRYGGYGNDIPTSIKITEEPGWLRAALNDIESRSGRPQAARGETIEEAEMLLLEKIIWCLPRCIRYGEYQVERHQKAVAEMEEIYKQLQGKQRKGRAFLSKDGPNNNKERIIIENENKEKT